MSDDTIQDKAGATRRNLMIMATGIVIFGFLQLPLDGKFIGVVDLKGVSQVQVWLVAWVGLWYFAVRYVMDPHSTDSLKKQLNESQELQERILLDMLEKDRHVEGSPPPAHWEGMDPAPSDAIRLQFVLLRPGTQSTCWRYNEKKQTAHATGWWKGVMPGQSILSDLTPSISISQHVPAAKLRKCTILAIAKSAQPTWPFLEYVFPLIWAFIANALCSVQMWHYSLPFIRTTIVRAWGCLVSLASLIWEASNISLPFSTPLIWA